MAGTGFIQLGYKKCITTTVWLIHEKLLRSGYTYLPTYFSVCAGQPSEFCRISQRDQRAAVER